VLELNVSRVAQVAGAVLFVGSRGSGAAGAAHLLFELFMDVHSIFTRDRITSSETYRDFSDFDAGHGEIMARLGPATGKRTHGINSTRGNTTRYHAATMSRWGERACTRATSFLRRQSDDDECARRSRRAVRFVVSYARSATSVGWEAEGTEI